MNKQYAVAPEANGERLDKWLATVNPDQTRSQILKLIKAGLVNLNGKVGKPADNVTAGDVVEVSEMSLAAKLGTIVDLTGKVEVVSRTDDYLVVNKPAGLIVHYPQVAAEVEPERSPSLADWLVKNYPTAARVGEDPSRPGIVHRLDKAVSGLMALALNQASFDDLKNQFKARRIIKHYQTLVYGRTAKDEDTIDFPLERSASGKKMAARPKGGEGRKAITEFEVIKRFHNYTLLNVNLKTGRTHQIRAHLAAYGHPVVGDNIYSTAQTRRQNQKFGLNRVFLASVYLKFKDLSGRDCEFRADLPEELVNVLKTLK